MLGFCYNHPRFFSPSKAPRLILPKLPSQRAGAPRRSMPLSRCSRRVSTGLPAWVTRLSTRHLAPSSVAHHHCAFTNIEAASESNGAQQSGRSTPLQPNDPAAASMLALRLSAANPQPVARRNCLPADWRERPPAGRSELLCAKRIHLSPPTCSPQAQKRPAYPKNLSNRKMAMNAEVRPPENETRSRGFISISVGQVVACRGRGLEIIEYPSVGPDIGHQ